MKKLDPDRSLLDASLELFRLISKAELLLSFLEYRPYAERYSEKIESIKEDIRKSAPDVVSTISKAKHRFAEFSNVVHIETVPIPPFEPIPFYPPPREPAVQCATDPGPIIGTSAHHAGVYFLNSLCLESNVWTYTEDEFFVTAPPKFDANLLLVTIEWERYRVFGENAVQYEAPGARSFSTQQLGVIFSTGKRTIENRMREIGLSPKGDHSIPVIRQLADYLSKKTSISIETSNAAKEILRLEGLELVRLLNHHFE